MTAIALPFQRYLNQGSSSTHLGEKAGKVVAKWFLYYYPDSVKHHSPPPPTNKFSDLHESHGWSRAGLRERAPSRAPRGNATAVVRLQRKQTSECAASVARTKSIELLQLHNRRRDFPAITELAR